MGKGINVGYARVEEAESKMRHDTQIRLRKALDFISWSRRIVIEHKLIKVAVTMPTRVEQRVKNMHVQSGQPELIPVAVNIFAT